MKARIPLVAVLATLSAQTNDSAAATLAVASSVGVTILQTYPGMPRLDYSKVPWLDYSRLPWLKRPALPRTDTISATSVEGLMANLKADVESAASGLTAVTDRPRIAEQNAMASGEAMALAADYSTLLSQDLSTLLSQDLSVNYSQLLSTSLGVPTSPPRPNWNRQDPAVVRTPNGDMLVPTYPPRTAWGNAGMVVTAPGGAVVSTDGNAATVVTPAGAVVSMVPAPAQTASVDDSEALRDVGRQLQVVQKDVERLQIFLENLNNSTTPPAQLLEPGSSKQIKPGNPVQESRELPSDRLPSH